MNASDGVIELGPLEETNRLWTAADSAFEHAASDLIALCEGLDLGLRAVEILVFYLLQPIRDRFPATIAVQLEAPDAIVNVQRDAISVPRTLQFTEIVDLLSEADLECVAPGLHRGWEDRRFSCRRSRNAAQDRINLSLSAGDQDNLLVLSAYRNRIFRIPPPVHIRPTEILAASESLKNLMKGLRSAQASLE